MQHGLLMALFFCIAKFLGYPHHELHQALFRWHPSALWSRFQSLQGYTSQQP